MNRKNQNTIWPTSLDFTKQHQIVSSDDRQYRRQPKEKRIMTEPKCGPLTAAAIDAQAQTGGTPADMTIALRNHACRMEADRAELLAALKSTLLCLNILSGGV